MRQTLSQRRKDVDETITRSVPEIESTTDKMHTQAEWITSLFKYGWIIVDETNTPITEKKCL